jgi:hypothetical protein
VGSPISEQGLNSVAYKGAVHRGDVDLEACSCTIAR